MKSIPISSTPPFALYTIALFTRLGFGFDPSIYHIQVVTKLSNATKSSHS